MLERSLFMTVDDAQGKCEAWHRNYNEKQQSHGAIGNKTRHSAVIETDWKKPALRSKDEERFK